MKKTEKKKGLNRHQKVAILIVAALFMISVLQFAMETYDNMTKWGVLEGEIIYKSNDPAASPMTEPIPNSVPERHSDSIQVFLVRTRIDRDIKLLNDNYDKLYKPLESKYPILKSRLNDQQELLNKAEVLFEVSFGKADPNSQRYINAKSELEELTAEKVVVEEEFKAMRDSLSSGQRSYNSYFSLMIDGFVVHKSSIDANGHFMFEKVEKGEYYIFAYRVIADGKDITFGPPMMVYGYKLAGKDVYKFSWFHKITVEEKSYVKLNEENMNFIFK